MKCGLFHHKLTLCLTSFNVGHHKRDEREPIAWKTSTWIAHERDVSF